MLKISRQEINDVIKSARHPNAGKLSHDYALPLPEREFGEPLKSGKSKRWMFEGMPTGGKSDLQAWIDRAKRFDDMKVKFNYNLDDQTLKSSEDLTLKEQIKKSEEQIKKDQSKKVQLLEQLLNRLGIVAPAPAPAVAGFDEFFNSPIMGGDSGSIITSPSFDEQINPQNFGASTSSINWNTKTTRTKIRNALNRGFGIRATDSNVNKIIDWFKENPDKTPLSLTETKIKDALRPLDLTSFNFE
jgi:hypothetical protein